MVWKFIFGEVVLMVVSGFNIWSMMCLDPEQNMQMTPKTKLLFMGGGLFMTHCWLDTVERSSSAVELAWLVVCIYFLSSSMTDIMSCYVYDWFQIWGTVAGVYLIMQSSSDIWIGCSIVIFTILQGTIFMRLYGRADGLAFLIAALAMGSLGHGIKSYLLHMIISYLSLAFIQICKGNIGKKGNLKKPVPFLPYITISFWIVIKTQIS